MALTEVVVQGTLNPDGTLQLDEKPNLSPGRVTVVLRQEAASVVPPDDPFWQRMQAIWDAQNAAGHVPRSVEEIEADRKQLRQGWESHQQAIEQIQQEGRFPRGNPERVS